MLLSTGDRFKHSGEKVTKFISHVHLKALVILKRSPVIPDKSFYPSVKMDSILPWTNQNL